MKARWSFLALAVLIGAALVLSGGCGGSGGGDDGDDTTQVCGNDKCESRETKTSCAADCDPGDWWTCQADDPGVGVYRVCNYFPLAAGNVWSFDAGGWTVMDEYHVFPSGYEGMKMNDGIAAGIKAWFFENRHHGLLLVGWHDGSLYQDLEGSPIYVAAPSMKVGETVVSEFIQSDNEGRATSTFVGIEFVSVPAGNFNALRFEIVVEALAGPNAGSSYKTTLWLAKDLGPVIMTRTEANPPDSKGCIILCGVGRARLRSATVDGVDY